MGVRETNTRGSSTTTVARMHTFPALLTLLFVCSYSLWFRFTTTSSVDSTPHRTTIRPRSTHNQTPAILHPTLPFFRYRSTLLRLDAAPTTMAIVTLTLDSTLNYAHDPPQARAESLVLEANGKDGLLTCAIRPAGIFG